MDREGDRIETEQGYTAEAVASYLEAVARERAELLAGIAAARTRRDAALALQGQISTLEQRVGNEIVTWLASRRQVAALPGRWNVAGSSWPVSLTAPASR